MTIPQDIFKRLKAEMANTPFIKWNRIQSLPASYLADKSYAQMMAAKCLDARVLKRYQYLKAFATHNFMIVEQEVFESHITQYEYIMNTNTRLIKHLLCNQVTSKQLSSQQIGTASFAKIAKLQSKFDSLYHRVVDNMLELSSRHKLQICVRPVSDFKDCDVSVYPAFRATSRHMHLPFTVTSHTGVITSIAPAAIMPQLYSSTPATLAVRLRGSAATPWVLDELVVFKELTQADLAGALREQYTCDWRELPAADLGYSASPIQLELTRWVGIYVALLTIKGIAEHAGRGKKRPHWLMTPMNTKTLDTIIPYSMFLRGLL